MSKLLCGCNALFVKQDKKLQWFGVDKVNFISCLDYKAQVFGGCEQHYKESVVNVVANEIFANKIFKEFEEYNKEQRHEKN